MYQSNNREYTVFANASRLAAAAAQSSAIVIVPSRVCIERLHNVATNNSGLHLMEEKGERKKKTESCQALIYEGRMLTQLLIIGGKQIMMIMTKSKNNGYQKDKEKDAPEI